ncbi:MAG TPA: glycosyltransferase family 2 protein [Dehalococcoidia bacterium]|nr:glycosyltransferase family 2 protein [Dehalococcoidia bacterium]
MLLFAVLLLAILVLAGTALNIVSASVGLGMVPEFPGSHWPFLVKNYVADAVLWMVLMSMAALAFTMARERGRRKRLVTMPRPMRQPMPFPRIAVALTAYNDELSIGAAVEDFKDRPGVETVIVVDNNCRDGTANAARRAGAVVVHEPNQGYGHACIRGLREALNTGADVIVLCEGDGTFSGHDIAKLVPFLEDAHMVVGNRITPGLVDRRSQMDTFFVWGNQLGAKLLQLRFWDWQFMGKLRLSDLGCTFRAIRREALAEIIDELRVGGSHFSPEMIMVSMRKGHTIVEVPVTFWPRVGVSKGASNLLKAIGIGIAMFWMIISFPTKVPGALPDKTPARIFGWRERRGH